MIDKIALWLIKRLVFFWDRHGDQMAFCFARDEHTDYNLLVGRYYEDGYTYGTKAHKYGEGAE